MAKKAMNQNKALVNKPVWFLMMKMIEEYNFQALEKKS